MAYKFGYDQFDERWAGHSGSMGVIVTYKTTTTTTYKKCSCGIQEVIRVNQDEPEIIKVTHFTGASLNGKKIPTPDELFWNPDEPTQEAIDNVKAEEEWLEKWLKGEIVESNHDDFTIDGMTLDEFMVDFVL